MDPNQTEQSSIPQFIEGTLHRRLEPIDLVIIFRGAAGWSLFYSYLLCTKLPCTEVAQITIHDIDWTRGTLVRSVDHIGRSWEMSLPDHLLQRTLEDSSIIDMLFHDLYCDIDDPDLCEAQLNENLVKPSEYMKALLSAENRPLASLMSFRITETTTLPYVGTQVVN